MNLADTALLLTRPRPASERFLAALTALTGPFGQVVVAPLQEIVAQDVSLDDTPDTVFLFTSEQGARAAAALSLPAGRRAFCVGNRTCAVALALGYDAVSVAGTANDLVLGVRDAAPTGPLLHAHGAHTTGDVAARLAAFGFRVRAIVAYDQMARPLGLDAELLLQRPTDLVVPLFSARSAQLFKDAVQAPKARLAVAAISVAAALPVEEMAHGKVEIAPTADTPGLCDAVIRLLARPSIA